MKRYTIVDASAEGKLVVEVDLDRRYSNGAGLLHGGAVGLIFDMFTTAAHIPIPDFDINNPRLVSLVRRHELINDCGIAT